MFQIWFGSWYDVDWFRETAGNGLAANLSGSGQLTATISYEDNSIGMELLRTGRKKKRRIELIEELIFVGVL